MLDCVIVGGGAAGLSAARWCDTLGMSYAVLERQQQLGGQLNSANHPIADYLGAPAADGPAMAVSMAAHARSGRGAIIVGDDIVRLDVQAKVVFTATREIKARTLVLAMGARPCLLGVPGENNFEWEQQPPDAAPRDAHVLVVGGGDNAVDAANAAAANGARVQLLVRGDLRSLRAVHVPVLRDVNVLSIEQQRVRVSVSGVEKELQCNVFIRRIGYAPNSDGVRDQLRCDDLGFVCTELDMMTSVPGVFAIGDLVTPAARQSVANAVGQGACAARSAHRVVCSLGA